MAATSRAEFSRDLQPRQFTTLDQEQTDEYAALNSLRKSSKGPLRPSTGICETSVGRACCRAGCVDWPSLWRSWAAWRR